MIGGMGQRRPPTGPSPFTAGKPNPMAGFQGGASPVGPQWGAGGPNPGVAQVQPGRFGGPAQGVGPQYGGASPVGAQQRFGGGFQGSPPRMGGGGGFVSEGGPSDPSQWFNPGGGAQGVGPNLILPAMQGAMGGGATGVGPNLILPGAQQMLSGMKDVMGGGATGVGPNMILPGGAQAMQQMQGAMGPGFQRRFPGALQRGILQGMAQPPPAPAAPAPYGGQQFRMW